LSDLSRPAPAAVVIGGGPYGLSVAAHLIERGVRVRVFGDAMSSWRRNMPVGMFLKSTPSASSISAPRPGYTLADFCELEGTPPLDEDDVVPIDLFLRYGTWFQEQLVPLEPERITHVTRRGGGYHVELDSGEVINTPVVIVASGHVGYAHVPAELMPLAGGEALPTARLSHTCHWDDLSRFAGREVAVIGAGQSALESAALLNEAGAGAHLVVRARRIIWSDPPTGEAPTWWQNVLQPPSPLGEGWSHVISHRGAPLVRYLPARARLAMVKYILGPFGSWWLHDRVVGQVHTVTGRRIESSTVQGDKAVLNLVGKRGAREQLVVDHVLAATGYRVDVDAIDFLDAPLRARVDRVAGSPVLGAGFESSVPGLYFVGLSAAATFGPLLRFVCGTEFAAPRLARAVARR
jgi:cation diffusion facilitator CzcD-associated flavoprotein CzcO